MSFTRLASSTSQPSSCAPLAITSAAWAASRASSGAVPVLSRWVIIRDAESKSAAGGASTSAMASVTCWTMIVEASRDCCVSCAASVSGRVVS
eukprot:scaffold35161_cov64-Phaeocystis_antarctica.AAC.13